MIRCPSKRQTDGLSLRSTDYGYYRSDESFPAPRQQRQAETERAEVSIFLSSVIIALHSTVMIHSVVDEILRTSA